MDCGFGGLKVSVHRLVKDCSEVLFQEPSFKSLQESSCGKRKTQGSLSPLKGGQMVTVSFSFIQHHSITASRAGLGADVNDYHLTSKGSLELQIQRIYFRAFTSTEPSTPPNATAYG